jgi:hypothetical protein
VAPTASTPNAAALWVSRVNVIKQDAVLSMFISFNEET